MENHTVAAEEHRMDTAQVISQSIVITLIPAGAMLLLGLLTVFWPRPPSKPVAHAIQHLAAGILLSAIALELMPTIAAAHQRMSIVGLVVGFALGSAVMVTLPLIFEEEDEEGDQTMAAEENVTTGAAPHPSTFTELDETCSGDSENVNSKAQVQSQVEVPITASPVSAVENEKTTEGGILHRLFLRRIRILRRLLRQPEHPICPADDGNEKALGGQSAPPTASKQHFPATFAAAVFVDSFMDGLLVGISLITGESAGVFMAVAMASEMGFLGISFATACAPMPKWKSLPAVCGGPAFMILGATVGGAAANALSVNEPLLVGCTSFGVAALLYMVTEELLVSAHEDGFGHRWWVDVQVFVGFLLAMVVGKLLEKNEQ